MKHSIPWRIVRLCLFLLPLSFACDSPSDVSDDTPITWTLNPQEMGIFDTSGVGSPSVHSPIFQLIPSQNEELHVIGMRYLSSGTPYGLFKETFFVSINSDGEMLSHSSTEDYYPYSVRTLPDGSYWKIVTTINDFQPYNRHLIFYRIDQNGGSFGSGTLGISEYCLQNLSALHPSFDGDLLAAGHLTYYDITPPEQPESTYVWAASFAAADGSLNWKLLLGENQFRRATAITPTVSGRALLLTQEDGGTLYSHLIDDQGNLLQSNALGSELEGAEVPRIRYWRDPDVYSFDWNFSTVPTPLHAVDGGFLFLANVDGFAQWVRLNQDGEFVSVTSLGMYTGLDATLSHTGDWLISSYDPTQRFHVLTVDGSGTVLSDEYEWEDYRFTYSEEYPPPVIGEFSTGGLVIAQDTLLVRVR